MMDGKAIWKLVIAQIAKASREFAPEPHKGGLQHPLEPPVAMANMLVHSILHEKQRLTKVLR